MAQLCLPNATDSFNRSSSTCQTPRSVSEKMSKATFYFKGLDVCAGRFFGRETECGFWLKKWSRTWRLALGMKRSVAFGKRYEVAWNGVWLLTSSLNRQKCKGVLCILSIFVFAPLNYAPIPLYPTSVTYLFGCLLYAWKVWNPSIGGNCQTELAVQKYELKLQIK